MVSQVWTKKMELVLLCILSADLLLVQQYQALPISGLGPTTEEGLTAEKVPTAETGLVVQLAHMAHRRVKRCSCENHKDKECVYFCHIGIVWVNTPSQVVAYALDSAGPVRVRRGVVRCDCTHTQDTHCLQFCSVPHTHTQ